MSDIFDLLQRPPSYTTGTPTPVEAADAIDILDRFPSVKTPRPVQAQAIREVNEAFRRGKKFVVLEAPTGSGKSLMAMTLAGRWGKTAVCTKGTTLQAQYVNEPDFQPLGLKELKGRTHFTCEKRNSVSERRYSRRFLNCREGQIAKCRELTTSRDVPDGGVDEDGVHQRCVCPYEEAKKEALAPPVMICNYHSFLWNVDMAEGWPDGKFLVLDEAHEIESVLMEFVEVSVAFKGLPPGLAPPPAPVSEISVFFEWVRACAESLIDLIASEGNLTKKEELKEQQRKMKFVLGNQSRVSWVVEPKTGEGKDAKEWREGCPYDSFALKPVTVSAFAGKFFRHADKVLLMSATILDHELFCEGLGIPLDQTAYVQVPCTFPAANRPILSWDVDMSFDARFDEDSGGSWPQMVEWAKDILEHHQFEKGLLLAPSNVMLSYLVEHLPEHLAKRLLVAYGEVRQEQLQKHLEGREPTVLAASGLWEGIDLHGDLSRFQIIPAMPRPALTPQVKARMRLNGAWYGWRTSMRMIQGTGRSIRSEIDSATTYCFDEAFRRDRYRPAWLREAVKEVPWAWRDLE